MYISLFTLYERQVKKDFFIRSKRKFISKSVIIILVVFNQRARGDNRGKTRAVPIVRIYDR